LAALLRGGTILSEDGYDIRTGKELLGHKDVKTAMVYSHVLNRGGARCAQPARPAAKGAVGGEPGDYADRGVRITFQRRIAVCIGIRYTAGGYGRDAALALSRYADREGFYAGQPKQELGNIEQLRLVCRGPETPAIVSQASKGEPYDRSTYRQESAG
jgi:hypothetical protein